jgi:Arc/MetJ-type ribon-helix-helix transcriptional regulator
LSFVKVYIHARLSPADRQALDKLKAATGRSESELVREGVRLAAEQLARRPSARDLAGTSVGRFTTGPKDLSADRKHLDGFGE